MSAPISPESTDAGIPAVNASNTIPGGLAVYGYSQHGHGVEGRSEGSKGVVGMSADFQGVYGHSGKNAGVVGESATWVGVYGKSTAPVGGIAVMGEARTDGHDVSGNGTGVFGASTHGHGVEGTSVGSKGVVGTSTEFQGVYGHSEKNAGIVGESTTWVGVYGRSLGSTGIAVMGDARADGQGVSGTGTGVFAASTSGAGVNAVSSTGEAIRAETDSPTVAALAAFNNNEGGTGAAVYAKKAGLVGHAGYFDGDVAITRHLYVDLDVYCTGGDLAEEFGVVGDLEAEPGTVVVLAGDDQVRVSDQPYDRRVAGVISGAATYRPALVLDRRPVSDRRPLALTGKVWCKVEADTGPISLGDLLTTSSTPGHAMRAQDSTRAFGAVLGKALAGLASGRALIPVLVALQ